MEGDGIYPVNWSWAAEGVWGHKTGTAVALGKRVGASLQIRLIKAAGKCFRTAHPQKRATNPLFIWHQIVEASPWAWDIELRGIRQFLWKRAFLPDPFRKSLAIAHPKPLVTLSISPTPCHRHAFCPSLQGSDFFALNIEHALLPGMWGGGTRCAPRVGKIPPSKSQVWVFHLARPQGCRYQIYSALAQLNPFLNWFH